MNHNRISISPAFPSTDGNLFLPVMWIRHLQLHSGRYQVAFGAKKMTVQIGPIDYGVEPGTMLVSRNIVEALHLPVGTPLSFFRKGSSLRFGYVFGLMADIGSGQQSKIGLQRPIIQQTVMEAEKQGMFAYVFSPLDIDFKNSVVAGYRLDRQGDWKRVLAPLPDVMHDRIISRAFTASPPVAAKIEQLYQRLGRRFFNKGFFHKWQLHQWLSSDSETADYVPDTVRFASTEQAARFLKQYGDVYLKPSLGALGAGIIRVRRKTDGRLHYQVRQENGSVREGHDLSADAFLQKNKRLLQRGQYILQQTLDLMKWNKRPFDIRLLLQKDGNGQWKRTKMFCRMAHTGDITNNLSAGAEAMEVETVLQDVFQDRQRVQQSIRELERSALQTAALLEQRVSGSLGELGFDFAFDQKGKVWIIEVNSKPMKRQNSTDGARGERNQLAYERAVQYAYYLCETDTNL